MIDYSTLRQKIIEIYPDLTKLGIDVGVSFDEKNQLWTVRLEHTNHWLRTYLDQGDVEICLAGKQCINLGLEIAKLCDSIKA